MPEQIFFRQKIQTRRWTMFGKKKSSSASERIPIAKKFVNVVKIVKGDIENSGDTYGKIRKYIFHAGQVLFASGEKFMKDDCLTKASSIAYTLIVSLIPILTVGLTFMSFGTNMNREYLFSQIQKLLVEYNLSRLNLDPYLDAISTLLDNATRIGGIGIIVLIFSATAILRTMEHSLNTIWRTQKERPLVLKMVYYWAALTLLPIMMIAGTTAATQISSIFSSPNNNAVYTSPEGSLWVAGNRGIIRRSSPKSNFFQHITTDQVDFDNQKLYTFDNASQTFEKEDAAIDETEFAKLDFNAIYFQGSKGWITAKNGYMLVTDNDGARWRIERWGQFNLNDIAMVNEKTGFIATSGGFLLKTNDGGASWETMSYTDITSSINKIVFRGKNGYALCNRGYIIKTSDSGANWNPILIDKSKIKKKHVNLNSISFIDDTHAWIACDEGLILMTSDGLSTFTQSHFKTYNYSTICMTSLKSGFAAGDDGVIIKTLDNGKTWFKKDINRGKINMLASRSGEIWAAGSGGVLVNSDSMENSWNGEKGTGFVIGLLNFFGPFLFIWLSFLLIYLLLPNIKVPFKPAAIGASITGAIWVGFLLGFIVYVKSFANGTFAVYGALAAFPIFLLLVYASTVIVLYGAEVSYMIVYIHSYLRKKRMKKSAGEALVYTGLRIINDVYKRFEAGEGSTTHDQIIKMCEKTSEADYYISLFKSAKLLYEKDGSEYTPATSSSNVRISDLISLIHDASYEIPANAPNDNLKKNFSKLFGEIGESRNKIVGDMRLSEIF
jgi:membrane protein